MYGRLYDETPSKLLGVEDRLLQARAAASGTTEQKCPTQPNSALSFYTFKQLLTLQQHLASNYQQSRHRKLVAGADLVKALVFFLQADLPNVTSEQFQQKI